MTSIREGSHPCSASSSRLRWVCTSRVWPRCSTRELRNSFTRPLLVRPDVVHRHEHLLAPQARQCQYHQVDGRQRVGPPLGIHGISPHGHAGTEPGKGVEPAELVTYAQAGVVQVDRVEVFTASAPGIEALRVEVAEPHELDFRLLRQFQGKLRAVRADAFQGGQSPYDRHDILLRSTRHDSSTCSHASEGGLVGFPRKIVPYQGISTLYGWSLNLWVILIEVYFSLMHSLKNGRAAWFMWTASPR